MGATDESGRRSVADQMRNYEPIRNYALIGDCHGSALVTRDGSIDWCCLGRFDADPVFCRILDIHQGGFLSVAPLDEFSVVRSYVDATNILQTIFETNGGKVVVTDFMPVGRRPGSGVHNYVDLTAPKWLVRIVEVPEGSADVSIRYRPTLEFGRKPAALALGNGCISTENGPFLYHNASCFSLKHNVAEATVSLGNEQRVVRPPSGWQDFSSA